MGSDPREESLRYEIKIAGQEASYERLRMLLQTQPEAIGELYPPRQVQSLYLDSPFGRALEENLAGISHREKLRFRWYGAATREAVGKLELKVRENMLGWKHAVTIDGALRLEDEERMAFARTLSERVPETWRERLAGLEAVQWVSYEREYLTTADRRVRLTIDRALRTWDQRWARRLSRRSVEESRRPKLFVLELKCAPADLEVAENIVRRLPWPVGRCSKFVLASDPSEGPIPSLEPY